MLGYPFRETGQHPLAAPFAADEYRHIIGVAAKAQPSTFQFLVQRIQVDVG